MLILSLQSHKVAVSGLALLSTQPMLVNGTASLETGIYLAWVNCLVESLFSGLPASGIIVSKRILV